LRKYECVTTTAKAFKGEMQAIKFYQKTITFARQTQHQSAMATEKVYEFQALEDATEVLRALAHPYRILIVEMLHRKGSLNVTEIHEALELEQAVASHQLRILKDKGIVAVKRDGKNSNYMLTDPTYFRIIQMLMEKI